MQQAPRRTGWSRRRRIIVRLLLAVALLIALPGCWLLWRVRAPLPRLDGEFLVDGVDATIGVERDERGVPTITAESRRDLAYGLGWVHAQDRFFQMDLLRRRAAGELAELVGAAALPVDRATRVHQFRRRAESFIASLSKTDRELVESYTRGVNAARRELRAAPIEYLLLGGEPTAWKTSDCLLVQMSMYLLLQERMFARERALGTVLDTQPALFEFLTAPDPTWDAPLDESRLPEVPIPSSCGQWAAEAAPEWSFTGEGKTFEPAVAGSNCWAVAGAHTKHGAAILANDMHLPLSVPNTWYRCCLILTGDPKPQEPNRAIGVTLPGGPTLVSGSNGHIAWGFTNSQGDWADLVVVEPDPQNEERYLTSDGPREYEVDQEVLRIKKSAPETLEVRKTIWGPIIGKDHRDQPLALRWLAHDRQGSNLSIAQMAGLTSVDEALDLAARAGGPQLNLIVADKHGTIGWTIFGCIPRRQGPFDSRAPTSWADGRCGWQGYLEPAEYPRISRREGALWTANARPVGEPEMSKISHGGFARGARAAQIRDHLYELLDQKKVTARDMLVVQLDDRALFLERWRTLLLESLPAAPLSKSQRARIEQHVQKWGGRAAVDSTGFLLVHDFRQTVVREIMQAITAPSAKADTSFDVRSLPEREQPVWLVLQHRPAHLLPANDADYCDEVLATAIAKLAEHVRADPPTTWGDVNAVQVQHPISRAQPRLSRWLDMPPANLPGAPTDMPRVQSTTFGASERFAVAPGHENKAYFHMPGGQSGQPWSPHYRDGHQAWVAGRPEPFVPGQAVHRLTLTPR